MGIAIGIGISPVLVRLSSGLNPPAYALASVYLDGTIVDVSGSKYFVDKKGGANVLITGYDFPDGWVKGFPYKSAATIDVFGQTGVPVVSLFQNFDYADQYFCKHIAQVVDGNGVEISEPYVSAIVAYSEPLTGADLTAANTYFGVPVEVTTNVKWVDGVNGLDTNAGTKALPYKTLNQATKTVTNYTIYVKSATYTEVYTSLNYWYILKANTIIGIGLNVLKSVATDRLCYPVGGVNSTFVISNFIFDGENKTTDNVDLYDNVALITFNRCFFKGVKTRAASVQVANTAVFNYCIGIETTNKSIVNYGIATFNTCYFKNIQLRSITTATIKNSKILSTVSNINLISIEKSQAEIYGNVIEAMGACILATSGAMATTKILNIHHNTMYVNDRATNASLYCISVLGIGSKYTVTIKNNTIKQLKTGALTSTTCNLIYLNDQVAPEISNNIILSNSTNLQSAINHTFGGTVVSGINKVNYNYISVNHLTGATLTIGYENGYLNIADGSEIIGNTVIGYKLLAPLSTGTAHGILANCGKNMIIKYNKVAYFNAGLVVKTGGQDTYTSGGVFYNLLVDNCNSLYVRGIAGINLFGNTIFESETTYTNTFDNGIQVDENTAIVGDQFSENVIIKNNIFDIKKAVGSLVKFDAHASANGCVSEYNQLFGGQYLLVDGTNYSDLATAQAAGKLLNCAIGDPLLNALLIPATPISGADLGAAYKTGLDTSSTFGSDTTTPVIVTKDQGATWQKGAFVQ
jgi:hypothetical protein